MFEGAPVGLLDGDALCKGRLVEIFEACVAGDAFAAEDELFEGVTAFECFFAETNALYEVFLFCLTIFAAFQVQDFFRVFDGHGLWGVVFGDGGAQFAQFFPYRFFAFGKVQKVEQDGDPYYDVRRGHVFEVLHKFLRKKSYF